MQLELELGVDRILIEGAISELGPIQNCCGCNKDVYIWCYIPVFEDMPNMYSRIHACYCKKCYDERNGDYYNREREKINKIEHDTYLSRKYYYKKEILIEKNFKNTFISTGVYVLENHLNKKCKAP